MKKKIPIMFSNKTRQGKGGFLCCSFDLQQALNILDGDRILL